MGIGLIRVQGSRYPPRRWCERGAYSRPLGGDLMLTKCANPSCEQEFQYDCGGELFLFEPESVLHDGKLQKQTYPTEYFWLCQQCASMMTIISDSGATAVVIPLGSAELLKFGTA